MVAHFRDGPLSFRRPEQIGYATGTCPLGHALIASGDKGIVAILIRGRAFALLPDLRSEFPKATLVRDDGQNVALAKLIAYLARPSGRLELPLDLRGTPFQQRVWREVQKIPAGETSSYSNIAQAIGEPKAIRAVASSCTHCRFAFAVPCHRVQHKASATARDAAARRRLEWVAYEARLLARLT
jgi:AraC family transcriptional regulator, regulatory protein of adaptative response / methylated-DNA-[protein]-cysteine methyltransferase